MAKKRLSELEAMVLGLIASEGPCTAYAVRRIVGASLSAQWSGSAGAVYPAVARLQEHGLVRAREQATGKRVSQALTATAAGKRALAAWLKAPTDPLVLGIPPDPIRLRLRFFALLSADERLTFLDEAITTIENTVAGITADIKRSENEGSSPYEVAMAKGALYATNARLRMLTELKASL